MVDALWPGLHAVLMSSALAGRALHFSQPCHWSWEGPEASDLEQWTKCVCVGGVEGPCETRGLGLRLEGHPYLPCPASPGPQVTEATRSCLQTSLPPSPS